MILYLTAIVLFIAGQVVQHKNVRKKLSQETQESIIDNISKLLAICIVIIIICHVYFYSFEKLATMSYLSAYAKMYIESVDKTTEIKLKKIEQDYKKHHEIIISFVNHNKNMWLFGMFIPDSVNAVIGLEHWQYEAGL